MTELGDTVRDVLQGRSGRDALAALLTATGAYVTAHPGRSAATAGQQLAGRDDPLVTAASRLLGSIAAMLRGSGIGDDEMDHAIGTLAAPSTDTAPCRPPRGFKWSADPETFDWMIRFLDRGLRTMRPPARNAAG